MEELLRGIAAANGAVVVVVAAADAARVAERGQLRYGLVGSELHISQAPLDLALTLH